MNVAVQLKCFEMNKTEGINMVHASTQMQMTMPGPAGTTAHPW